MPAVIGPTCASTIDGVVDVLMSEQGVVVISPSHSGPALTHPSSRQPLFFRTMHNDKLQGQAMAEFAFHETGARRAATIRDSSPYSELLRQAFAQSFAGLGGTIAAEKSIKVGETDFLPLLRDFEARNLDFLYLPIFLSEGGLIAEQTRTLPRLKNVDLAGSDVVFTPDFIEAAGTENADGVYVSAPNIMGFRGNQFYREQVLPAYEQRFGKELFDS